MKFAFYIARHYFFSRRSHNVINIISAISAFGVAIGTMALIAVLSVFNGFDSLIQSLFNSFDPDIKITSATGKTFDPANRYLSNVYKLKEVAYYTEIVEGNALLRNGEKQHVAVVKGVDHNFSKVSGIDSMLISGDFILKKNESYFAIIGNAISYSLNAAPGMINPIEFYAPNRNASIQSVTDAFNVQQAFPMGVFSIQQDFDSKYVIVPIELARKLFGYTDEITGVEIKLNNSENKEKVLKSVKEVAGSEFVVKDRFMQNELLYKIMNSEKWAIFLILTFILLIASFNVIGSLTMLIIEKKSDIEILVSLGANNSQIRNIFLLEGWFVSIAGALLGLALGFILCWAQEEFGLIKLGGSGQSFLVDAYPVKMQASDFIKVLGTVLLIGFFAAWFPVKYIAGKLVKR